MKNIITTMVQEQSHPADHHQSHKGIPSTLIPHCLVSSFLTEMILRKNNHLSLFFVTTLLYIGRLLSCSFQRFLEETDLTPITYPACFKSLTILILQCTYIFFKAYETVHCTTEDNCHVLGLMHDPQLSSS